MALPDPAPARPRRPRRRRSRLLLGGLLALAGLAAAHAVLWRAMAGRLEAGLATWSDARRAAGWAVEHGTPVRGGWPLAASLTLPGFRLAGGGATLPGGMEWRADRLALRVALPRLDRLAVEPRGPQRLRLGVLDLPFAADRLEVLLPLETGVPPRGADLLAERLRLGTPAGTLEAGRAALSVTTRSTATEGEAAVSAELEAEAVDLPPAGPGLPRRLESLAAGLSLTGPLPAGRDPTARAADWRDGGGTLELRGLRLRWGALEAAGAATLALDARLQPMGAGTVRLTGASEAVRALAAAGAINARAAAAALALLPLLARVPEEGGAARVELPVTLEDRALAVARLGVARLPALDWPAAR